MKEVLLLKSKAKAIKSPHLCNMTVAVELGIRIQRLRKDKAGELIIKGFKALHCVWHQREKVGWTHAFCHSQRPTN